MNVTGQASLNIMRPEFEEIKEEKIKSTGMPLEHYLQETIQSITRFSNHRKELEAGKMDFAAVEKIQTIANACRELNSESSTITFPASSSRRAWVEASEEADLLLYDMKEAARFAMRDFPDLLSVVSTIYNEGGSNADKIQDLNDFAVLGRNNQELFDAIHYPMDNFERAAVLSKDMAVLLAQATLDRSTSPVRILRNKAFTLLKQNIDELNDQARYIFRSNKNTAGKFRINPPRSGSYKKKSENSEETNSTTTA